jgi:hypothetical protein
MHKRKHAPLFLGLSSGTTESDTSFAGLLPAYDDGASSLKLLKEKKHTQTGQQ